MFGKWVDPGISQWEIVRNDPYYVDKTGMLAVLNTLIERRQRFIAVTRPRRFGKTTDKNMIAAYYDKTVDGTLAFADLQISFDPSFDLYRNRYHVISFHMLSQLGGGTPVSGIYNTTVHLLSELSKSFSEANIDPNLNWEQYWASAQQHIALRKIHGSSEGLEPVSCSIALQKALTAATSLENTKSVVLIDEWDAFFFRKFPYLDDENAFYLDFLRDIFKEDIFKDKNYIALAYLTGILPVKKYGGHSALNMFEEYSMLSPGSMAPYMGFTEDQVLALCDADLQAFQQFKNRYDGYLMLPPSKGKICSNSFQQFHIYSPYSVSCAIRRREIENYWNQSETFKALQDAVIMPFGGLKYVVSDLMQRCRRRIDTRIYQNDMTSFQQMDDVLTMLVHLGYLAYDAVHHEVFIPNQELMDEFTSAVKGLTSYRAVQRIIQDSERMLHAIWQKDRDTVAACIQTVMDTVDEHSCYNEQVLVMAIRTAMVFAVNYYTFFTEVPAGRGRAGLLGIPLPDHPEVPALLIETKIDKSAESAIDQIRSRHYPEKLQAYAGNLLFVRTNYDKSLKSTDPAYKKWTDIIIENA